MLDLPTSTPHLPFKHQKSIAPCTNIFFNLQLRIKVKNLKALEMIVKIT